MAAWRPTKAYPRACGGPGAVGGRVAGIGGLSPRLRGTPDLPEVFPAPTGPIPAPAGDPDVGHTNSRETGAYPRACGGPMDDRLDLAVRSGLSPRLRGTQELVDIATRHQGPIPAPAGDPKSRFDQWEASGAYPRACGGPPNTSTALFPATGLSPRLRGTQQGTDNGNGNHGPIPAPAGDPRIQTSPACRHRAYPRACGGPVGNANVRAVDAGLSPRLRGTHEKM